MKVSKYRINEKKVIHKSESGNTRQRKYSKLKESKNMVPNSLHQTIATCSQKKPLKPFHYQLHHINQLNRTSLLSVFSWNQSRFLPEHHNLIYHSSLLHNKLLPKIPNHHTPSEASPQPTETTSPTPSSYPQTRSRELNKGEFMIRRAHMWRRREHKNSPNPYIGGDQFATTEIKH